MYNKSLLYSLIEDDFGIEPSGGGRWYRSTEHSSLVYDAEKDMFFFNTHNISGDSFVYLTKVRNWPYSEAKDYLKHKNISATFIHEIRNKEEVVVYPKLVKIFHENLLTGADKEYFYKRTITDETISRFELGYDNGFYMIPIYQDGLFKQFQMRKDYPVKTIKNYYRGVGGLLFNSEVMRMTNKIVFVEGVTSCIVLNQNGIPCVSSNTGAEGFMARWFPYFQHQDEIVILNDNDSAGKLGAIKVANILGNTRCKIYTFEGEEPKYDLNDWFIDGRTVEELMSTIKEKSKYSFELDFKDKKKRRF